MSQTAQCQTHFFLVGLGLRLHGNVDHRLREFHALERDHRIRIAQRFAGGDLRQTDGGGDVTGTHFINLFAVVGVHLHQAADALLLALDRVVDRVARLHHARVDADEGQLADVLVGHQLERQRRKLLAVVSLTRIRLLLLVRATHGRDVDRRRQVLDNGVKHRLHALVLECRTTQHRHDLALDGAVAQSLLEFDFRQVAFAEILLHHLFGGFGGGFEHLFAPLLGLGLEFGGDVAILELGALGGVVPQDSLHLDEVDHAGETFFSADRNLDRDRVGLEARAHLVVHLEEVSALAVHLVDESQARNAVLVGLTPHSFGLRLNTTDSAIDHAGAIEHTHRALDFDGEVDVARGVDDVDAVLLELVTHALPETGRGSRGDGDAALLLLLHPVHGGRAIVHFTDLVVDAGVEQDAFGGRGLAGVDVRRDTDVAVTLDGGSAGHGQILGNG